MVARLTIARTSDAKIPHPARVLHDQPAADKGFAEDGQSHLDEIKEPDDFGSAMLCRRDRSRYYFGSV